MSQPLRARLRASGYVPPDYTGRGLLNVAGTVVDALGVREEGDPPPLRDLDPALTAGIRCVVVVLADGLGWDQLERLCRSGDTPFLASLVQRAQAEDGAQLLRATTIFPSTTAAAVTTLHTARTPQEHGNIAYFLWLDEFRQVTQMLRWGAAASRRGSFFDDHGLDPRTFVKVGSLHARLRRRGGVSYLIEPEIFRSEAMTRMHAAEAEYAGYLLPSTMGARLRELLAQRPWGEAPAYLYAYWSGIDTAGHQYGPGSAEHDDEASAFDRALDRGLAGRTAGDTLVLLTADHGHAAVDPSRLLDLEGDRALRRMLRNPIAGEPRCVFLHTDHPGKVMRYLEDRYPASFFLFERDEALADGLFGSGDPSLVRRRVGEVCALLGGDRGAVLVRVDGKAVLHRGSHGGMTPAEMCIPVLAFRA